MAPRRPASKKLAEPSQARKRTVTEAVSEKKSSRTINRPAPLVLRKSNTSSHSAFSNGGRVLASPASTTVQSLLRDPPRPALFTADADVSQRIATSIELLRSAPNPDGIASIALIHDITQNLAAAQYSLRIHGKRDVERRHIDELEKLFTTFKKQKVDQIRSTILSLGRRPIPLTGSIQDVHLWRQKIQKLLYLAREYAKAHGLSNEWEQVERRTKDTFTEAIMADPASGEETKIDSPIRVVAPSGSYASLRLPVLSSPSAVEVESTVEQILNFYATQTDPQEATAFVSFDDLQELLNAFAVLLSPATATGTTLLEEYVNGSQQAALANASLSFASAWGGVLQEDINSRFQLLAQAVDQTLMPNLEEDFVEVMDDIALLTQGPPSSVSIQDWSRYAPNFASREDALAAEVRFSHLYVSYQNQTYPVNETSHLWLLVWQSLKSIYFQLRADGFPTDETAAREAEAQAYLVDLRFFQSRFVRERFEAIVRGAEILSRHEIEDLVASYCKHISICQQNAGQYYSGLTALKGAKVDQTTLTSLQSFTRSVTRNEDQHRSLHKIASRLTKLLDGEDNTLQRTPRGDNFRDNGRSQQYQNALASMPEPPTRETMDLDVRYFPSALPYCRMPFSETRATVVMESRQISRDMADPGVRSEGPRESDIVNIPPRHVQLETQYNLRFSPSGIVRGLLRYLTSPRSTKLARVPGPLPGKDVLSPIVDRRHRISKPHSPSAKTRDVFILPEQPTPPFRNSPGNGEPIQIFEDATATAAAPDGGSDGSPGGSGSPSPRRVRPFRNIRLPPSSSSSNSSTQWAGLCHPCDVLDGREWHHMCYWACPGYKAALARGGSTCHPCPLQDGIGWHYTCGTVRNPRNLAEQHNCQTDLDYEGGLVRTNAGWTQIDGSSPELESAPQQPTSDQENRPPPRRTSPRQQASSSNQENRSPPGGRGPSPDYGPSSGSIPPRRQVASRTAGSPDWNQIQPGTALPSNWNIIGGPDVNPFQERPTNPPAPETRLVGFTLAVPRALPTGAQAGAGTAQDLTGSPRPPPRPRWIATLAADGDPFQAGPLNPPGTGSRPIPYTLRRSGEARSAAAQDLTDPDRSSYDAPSDAMSTYRARRSRVRRTPNSEERRESQAEDEGVRRQREAQDSEAARETAEALAGVGAAPGAMDVINAKYQERVAQKAELARLRAEQKRINEEAAEVARDLEREYTANRNKVSPPRTPPGQLRYTSYAGPPYQETPPVPPYSQITNAGATPQGANPTAANPNAIPGVWPPASLSVLERVQQDPRSYAQQPGSSSSSSSRPPRSPQKTPPVTSPVARASARLNAAVARGPTTSGNDAGAGIATAAVSKKRKRSPCKCNEDDGPYCADFCACGCGDGSDADSDTPDCTCNANHCDCQCRKDGDGDDDDNNNVDDEGDQDQADEPAAPPKRPRVKKVTSKGSPMPRNPPPRTDSLQKKKKSPVRFSIRVNSRGSPIPLSDTPDLPPKKTPPRVRRTPRASSAPPAPTQTTPEQRAEAREATRRMLEDLGRLKTLLREPVKEPDTETEKEKEKEKEKDRHEYENEDWFEDWSKDEDEDDDNDDDESSEDLTQALVEGTVSRFIEAMSRITGWQQQVKDGTPEGENRDNYSQAEDMELDEEDKENDNEDEDEVWDIPNGDGGANDENGDADKDDGGADDEDADAQQDANNNSANQNKRELSALPDYVDSDPDAADPGNNNAPDEAAQDSAGDNTGTQDDADQADPRGPPPSQSDYLRMTVVELRAEILFRGPAPPGFNRLLKAALIAFLMTLDTLDIRGRGAFGRRNEALASDAARLQRLNIPLPQRNEYERSTVVELRAEGNHRGNTPRGWGSMKKAELIRWLMEQDRLGRRGRGAWGRRNREIGRGKGDLRDQGKKTRSGGRY